MAKTKKVQLNFFGAGMKTSQRASNPEQFNAGVSVVRHFDIISDSRKLIPVPAFEKITDSESENFGIVGLGAIDSSNTLYGIGNKPSNWYGFSWGYRVQVSYETSTNYVKETGIGYMLIKLDDMPSSFWSNVNPDGSDIRTTDTSGNVLSSYLEVIDTTAKTGWLYVEGNIQDIFIYYGNADVSKPSAFTTNGRVDTFNGPFNGFHGFNNIVQRYDDGNINLTDGGTPTYVTGLVGDSLDNGLNLTCDNSNNPWSGISGNPFALVFPTGTGSTTSVINSANTSYTLSINASRNAVFSVNTATGPTVTATGSIVLPIQQWSMIHGVYNSGSSVQIYVNGQLDASTPTSDTGVDSSSGQDFAVNTTQAYVNLLGFASNIASADAVETNYNMYFLNDLCFSFGAEVAKSSVSITNNTGVQLYEYDIAAGTWSESLTNGVPIGAQEWNSPLSGTCYPIRSQEIVLTSTTQPGFLTGSISTGSYSTQTALSGARIDSFTGGVNIIAFDSLYDDDVGDSLITGIPSNRYSPSLEVAVDKSWYFSIGRSSITEVITGEATANSFSAIGSITSMSNYGQFLAIGSVYRAKSYIQLWDLDSSAADELINLGVGEVRTVGSIDNVLFGVIDGFSYDDTLSASRPFMDIKAYTGNSQSQSIYKYNLPQSVASDYTFTFDNAISQYSEELEGIHVWYAKLPKDITGTEYNQGLWGVGINRTTGETNVSIYADTSNIANLIFVKSLANNVFVLTEDNEIYKLSTSAYTQVSSLETRWYDDGDEDREKLVESVEVHTEELDSGQTVTVYYRKDGGREETDWIELFTHSSGITKKALRNESAEVQLPAFKEIQFKVESTGGKAPITGLAFTIQDTLNPN